MCNNAKQDFVRLARGTACALGLAGGILAWSSSSACAAPLNLTWSACPSSGGHAKLDVPCASVDTYTLVATLQVPDTMPCVISLSPELMIALESVPDFWQFGEGGCNAGGIGFSMDKSELGAACQIPSVWDGASDPVGGITGITQGDTTVRILLDLGTRILTDRVRLDPGRDYYAFHLTFSTANAAEAGGLCGGCMGMVAFSWTKCIISSFSCPESPVELALHDPGLIATWNGTAPTPALPTTWGHVKILYR